MKKLLLILLCLPMIGFSLLTFSQEAIFYTKYMQICEFDYDEDDFMIIEEEWINTDIVAYEEFAIIKIEFDLINPMEYA